jgi:hypothetical protein
MKNGLSALQEGSQRTSELQLPGGLTEPATAVSGKTTVEGEGLCVSRRRLEAEHMASTILSTLVIVGRIIQQDTLVTAQLHSPLGVVSICIPHTSLCHSVSSLFGRCHLAFDIRSP